MSRYKVWLVYEPGRIWLVRWYVVNTLERKVHSVWGNYNVAHKVAHDLNAQVRFGRIG